MGRVAATGDHRKHAIRLLGGQRAAGLVDDNSSAQLVGPGRDRIYEEAFVATLIVLWETADRISGTRLIPLLPLLVDARECDGRLALKDGNRPKCTGCVTITSARNCREATAAHGGVRTAFRRVFLQVG